MEGIIKTVTLDPVKLYTESEGKNTNCMVKVYFDPAALAKLYESAEIDPADVTAGYIVYDEDGVADIEEINLAEAVASGHEIAGYAVVDTAYVAGD